MIRRALLVLCCWALLAPAASAQGYVDDAVAALRTNPVYVHPDASSLLSDDDADRVRERIRRGDLGSVFVAVLPVEARDEGGGSTFGVLRRVANALGQRGTYALAAGREIRFANTDRQVAALGDAAVRDHRAQGLAAIVLGFLDRLGSAGDSPSATRPVGGNGDGGIPGGLILLGLAGLGVGAVAMSRRAKRKRALGALAEVKRSARDELVALGDDIRALELDVEMPDANPAARAEYDGAVAAYQRAEVAWEAARSPEELAPVGAALEEGRYGIAATRARLDNRPLPERRPPCFFDPRHGPSDRDVLWSPYGGAARPVPACEADAQRVERGEDPAAREVLVGGARRPYWEAGPAYGPFAGGMFGGYGGGLLPGLLIGTMLGNAMSPDVGYADDGGGFGDSGGGDFGGGGFDGGGFSGGDFGGGGDGGGGDF